MTARGRCSWAGGGRSATRSTSATRRGCATPARSPTTTCAPAPRPAAGLTPEPGPACAPGCSATRACAPTPASGPRLELIWHSIGRPHQSSGPVARRLLPALVRQGVDVTIAPTGTQPSRELERFHRDLDHWGRFGFYYDYRQRPSVLPAARIVNYAMWETSAVPERIVEDI